MPLPDAPGLGFKAAHFAGIASGRSPVGFWEVHAENYMGEGGRPHAQVSALRAGYPLSLQGVGASRSAGPVGSTPTISRVYAASATVTSLTASPSTSRGRRTKGPS